MRHLLATVAILSIVSLTACGGGAASSGVGGGAAGSSKPNPSAEVDAARADAETQEKTLSGLRQEKSDLEAQLEGNSAPAAAQTPAATPTPAAAPAAKDTSAPAETQKPSKKKSSKHK
jgi:hypothetical protein